MRKMIIFLLLLVAFLILYSCSKEPQVAEDPWFALNPGWWTMFFVIDITNNSNTSISSNIYYALLDKDKEKIYILFTNEFEYSGLFYPSLYHDFEKGVGRVEIPEDMRHLKRIKEFLDNYNITNAIFTFWVEIKKGTNTLILAGFDESMTNIGSGIYGLGMYEGLFDGESKITNIHKVVPIANYTNILESTEDFVKCHIIVEETNINLDLVAGKFIDSPQIDFSTNITIPF